MTEVINLNSNPLYPSSNVALPSFYFGFRMHTTLSVREVGRTVIFQMSKLAQERHY